MNHVNLIPRDRLEQRRSRMLLRRWSTVSACYVVFVFVALVASRVMHFGDDRTLQDSIDGSVAARTASEQLVGSLRSELLRSVDLLRANRAVGSQPDWSVLLALIGQATEGEIVLRHCRTGAGPGGRPALTVPASGEGEPSSGGRTSAPSVAATRLTLEGLGRSQEAVSRFVLRMDGIPLFEAVKLVDTRREPFLDGHATSFRVECMIDPGGETPP